MGGVEDEFGDLETALLLASDGGDGMSLPVVDLDGEVGGFGWLIGLLTIRFGFALSLDSWVLVWSERSFSKSSAFSVVQFFSAFSNRVALLRS